MLTPLQVLKTYRPHDYTLTDLFDSRAEGNGRPGLIFRGKHWSRAELRTAYLKLAGDLTQRGVRSGDRVAIMARNHIAQLLLLLACARLGAIMVPVNPELKPSEAGYIFGHSEVTGIVCDGALAGVVTEACAALGHAPWHLLTDPAADQAGAAGELAPSVLDIIATDTTQPSANDAAADAPCVIIYTSGTTGFPKGAMHSQRNFVTSGEANVARLWLQPDDRLLIVLPLFHVNALFYSLAGSLAAGATAIVAERFSASNFWAMAVETGATQVNFIDTIGLILKARPRSEFRPEHKIRLTYGVRPDEELCFRDEFGISNQINGFGMTEIPGIICQPYGRPHRKGALGPVGGHPDPHRSWAEFRIVDDAGNDLPDGEIGELWVKHPIVMLGYFRDPEQTRNAFEGPWFKTGDLMKRDAEGNYYFVTRKKDMIRRRGENIAGAELDRTIALHPDVHEVAVVPVPSDMGEEEILAAVVLRPGTTVTAREIAQWCADRLAAMKVPRYVAFVDELPHTPTFKVAKHVLKADKSLLGKATDTGMGKLPPREKKLVESK